MRRGLVGPSLARWSNRHKPFVPIRDARPKRPIAACETFAAMSQPKTAHERGPSVFMKHEPPARHPNIGSSTIPSEVDHSL